MWLVLYLSWFIGCIQLQTLITFLRAIALDFSRLKCNALLNMKQANKKNTHILFIECLCLPSIEYADISIFHLILSDIQLASNERRKKNGFNFILHWIIDVARIEALLSWKRPVLFHFSRGINTATWWQFSFLAVRFLFYRRRLLTVHEKVKSRISNKICWHNGNCVS